MNWYNGFSPDERLAAFAWLKKEYAAGRRRRPTRCDACGQTKGVIEAHSEDYSGPPYGDHIGQLGLCYRCHMMIHCRFRAQAAWDAYRAAVRQGYRYEAIQSRNFGAVSAQLRGAAVRQAKHRPPAVAVLDLIEAGHYIAHLGRQGSNTPDPAKVAAGQRAVVRGAPHRAEEEPAVPSLFDGLRP